MTDFSSIKFPKLKQANIKNDLQFSQWLVEEIGVAGVPCGSFYRVPEMGASQMRFSFGRKMEILKEAEKRLAGIRHN